MRDNYARHNMNMAGIFAHAMSNELKKDFMYRVV